MIQDFVRYLVWSNERLLQMLAQLEPSQWDADLGGSFGTMGQKASHLFGAIEIWLDRIEKGVSPGGFPVYAVPLEDFRKLNQRLSRYAGSIDDAELAREVSYSTTTGGAMRDPVAELLLHLVNHSSFHRGQIVDGLRRLGHPVHQTDYVFYRRKAGLKESPAQT